MGLIQIIQTTYKGENFVAGQMILQLKQLLLAQRLFVDNLIKKFGIFLQKLVSIQKLRVNRHYTSSVMY